jgi:K+-sensing histidine kinase KdpD
VDDLFELSRINAGALRLSLASVSLGDVVSDAVASAAPVAAAHGVRLVAAEQGWPTVVGSEPELSRVVANLLRNAIRHTPSDGTITVTGGRDADGGWLAVTDGCGGIPEADLPRVFDVAFRGHQARTRDQPNAGQVVWSLAIVRGLVEAPRRGQVPTWTVAAGSWSTARGLLMFARRLASILSSAWWHTQSGLSGSAGVSATANAGVRCSPDGKTSPG